MSIEFSGEYGLPVGLQKVWEGLNDQAVLRQSIRGCTELERLSEQEFQAVLTARVGPIGVTFRGQVTLKDIIPSKAYTLVSRAQGGAAGFGSLIARIELESIDTENTLIRYSAQADVGGKLASVGQRLIQSVAKKQADDFFREFCAVITGAVPHENKASALKPDEHAPEQNHTLLANQAQISGGLNAPVPAWLVVFVAGLGITLGYCIARLP